MKLLFENWRKYLNEAEETNVAPHGVIFEGNDKVFVGDDHANPVVLSDDLKKRIIDIGARHGYYGEGGGVGGAGWNPAYEPFKEHMQGNYKGSWDKASESGYEGDTSTFLYTIFANVDQNNRVQDLLSKAEADQNIFDLLVKTAGGTSGWAHEIAKGQSIGPQEVKTFLRRASDEEYNFLELSKQPATEESLTKFLKSGEDRSWPQPGWQDFPYNAGKVAQKAIGFRDQWLAKAGPGVYFVGAGHLLELMKINPSYQLVDGKNIATGEEEKQV